MIAESQSATMVMPKGAGQPPACSAKGPVASDLRRGCARATARSASGAGERDARAAAASERQARMQSTAVANGMTRGQKSSTQPRSSTGSATRMSSISVVPST